MKKKSLLAATLLLACLGTASCLGPDHLYNSIKNWNAKLSEKDWVNEGLYLVMVIIPVYPIALFGDALVFNTIDYWSGTPTINDPGEFPPFTRKDDKK